MAIDNALNFTRRMNGKVCATVRLDFVISREEYEELERFAEHLGLKGDHKWKIVLQEYGERWREAWAAAQHLATVTRERDEALRVVAELQPEVVLEREAALLDRAEKAERERDEARAALNGFHQRVAARLDVLYEHLESDFGEFRQRVAARLDALRAELIQRADQREHTLQESAFEALAALESAQRDLLGKEEE